MREEVPENTELPRRTRRRKQAIAGVAGLAVLGAGAYLVTTQVTGDGDVKTREVGAMAPVATPEPSQSASAAASASVAASPAKSSATPKPATTSKASKEEQIAAVRKLARQPNNQVRQPLPQKPNQVTDEDLTVADTGNLKKDHATLRVVSARQDLTGQRELSTVADGGEAVGDARCTQTFRFGAGAPAVQKPTLLICWRTSAEKSVYTVAVDLSGKPSKEKSVAALDAEWDSLP